MIHKLRAGMMPPSGARRPADGADHAAGRRARNAHGCARGGRSESGVAAVPAIEPRRVRARGPAPARSRRRRDRVPARRHHQRRVRQRRRRADVLADADGRLPACREPHRDAGRRRSGRARRRRRPSSCRRRRRRWSAPRARRSAPAAASPWTTPLLPTATTCSAWTSSPNRSACCSAARAPGEEIEVSLDGARLALLRDRPAHQRRENRPHDQDARRST